MTNAIYNIILQYRCVIIRSSQTHGRLLHGFVIARASAGVICLFVVSACIITGAMSGLLSWKTVWSVHILPSPTQQDAPPAKLDNVIFRRSRRENVTISKDVSVRILNYAFRSTTHSLSPCRFLSRSRSFPLSASLLFSLFLYASISFLYHLKPSTR